MSYAELLGGLLYSGETVIQYNQFQHLQFSSLIMSDECNATISQRPGGICLLTDKRLLLLSSQVTQCMYTITCTLGHAQGGYSGVSVTGRCE